MKKIKFSLLLLYFVSSNIFSQHYADFFNNDACRVDFHFCGNATHTLVYVNKVKRESFWGGRRYHLSTTMNLGDFRFQIVDSLSNKLIYVDGFSALFHEWQTTPEALHTSKSFEQSIQFPFPKSAVTLIIEKRLDLDHWQQLFRLNLSPTDKLIRHNILRSIPVKVIRKTAPPENAIDIAVVAEGYTSRQISKFYTDVHRLTDNILSH